MERLQKFLASRGVASRRASERLIAAGRVSINGMTVTELGSQVQPGVDRVQLDGSPIGEPERTIYLVLNKPIGVVSTVSDPQQRRTVLDLVPKLGRLYPVGRLDADSEGLMLMTNDGELANRLMHPRYGCEKEYRALIREEPDAVALGALREGVALDDGLTAPARVELENPPTPDGRWLRITLREGRKRQVRRMLGAVGHSVQRLQRIRIGPLVLGCLPSGASRPLSRTELATLRASVGLAR